MTVGLIHFDSNIRRVLVLLNTNGVSVTDSEKEHHKIYFSLLAPDPILCI